MVFIFLFLSKLVTWSMFSILFLSVLVLSDPFLSYLILSFILSFEDFSTAAYGLFAWLEKSFIAAAVRSGAAVTGVD